MFAEMKRRRWKRVLVWTLAVVIALPVLAWTVLYGNSVWQRRKAERLFAEFQTLVPEQTDEATVARLMERYGATKSAIPDRDYAFEFGNWLSFFRPAVEGHRADRTFAWLDRVGLRPWYVHASFARENGRLDSAEFTFWNTTRGCDRKLKNRVVGVELWGEHNEHYWHVFRPRQGAHLVVFKNYPLRDDDSDDFMSSAMTTLANEDERRTAFDFRLECATRWRPCKEVSDMAPLAAEIYKRNLARRYRDQILRPE